MKRKKSGGGGANWMDTYGDMVTLLLCFFVLLYSMSTINEEKWQMVVQSFQRKPSSQAIGVGGKDKQNQPTDADVKAALTQIADTLNEYSVKNNLQQQMSVVQGADYVFITFQNAVFFEGDSPVLLDSGKKMLDEVSKAIAPQGKLIDELRVMGHTSQGSPDRPNDPTTDRFLASNRAATVTVYLQSKNIVDAHKLVSVSYGQWRPIGGFDTENERARNRRVELMVTGLDPNSSENSVKNYYTMRDGSL